MPNEPHHLCARDDVAIDHVDDFKLVLVQFIGCSGAGIVGDEDFEAFVTQRSHG